MNFDGFFEKVGKSGLELSVDHISIERPHLLNNEALFQLPLISLIVLLMAKDKRKPMVSEVGQLVGESIELSMPGFKGSAQHIGWSANLRVRTVKAISFLENSNLIDVNNIKGKVKATDLGKKVIGRAMEMDDDLSYNLSLISQSYRNICVSRQLDLELQ